MIFEIQLMCRSSANAKQNIPTQKEFWSLAKKKKKFDINKSD